jgi:2-C-methyl-D-erythritol 4-phosphate cytidylyltransferase
VKYWLVMPAAGSGRRFGGQLPKQYAAFGRGTVLEASMQLFLADARCAGAALALAADEPGREALRARLPASVRVVDGGAQRSASVLAGLNALAGMAAADDWVLVHDAVRPCLSAADLDRLLAAGMAVGDGALLAAPLADTLKSSADGQHSTTTVARAGLWRALTPQMFRYARLCTALQQAQAAGREPTDEAQALEWLGDAPLLVAAQDANPKITTATDLALAAAILAARAAPAAQPQGT